MKSLVDSERWLVRKDCHVLGVFPVKTYLAQERPRAWTRRRTNAVAFEDVNLANAHTKELKGTRLERL